MLSKGSPDTRSVKKHSNPCLYLIDGNSLVYRAFYALPDTMRTASGITTNAVYGFTNILLKLIDEQPDYMAVAFDLPVPTFRHREYAAYKATRQKAPESLRDQIPHIKAILAAFGVKVFEAEGYEADDIIAAVSRDAAGKGLKVRIFTGDKDALQLVTEDINVLSAVKGISETFLYTPETVHSKLGIKPGNVTDYKALAGDTSDNIPGIRGIGEKTAVNLISKYGTLEEIIKHAGDIEGKIGEKIRTGIDDARLSKRLATLADDVPVDKDLEKMRLSAPDWTKILPLFEKYEFKSFLKKYGGQQALGLFALDIKEKIQHPDLKTDYRLISDEKHALDVIREMRSAETFAFDTETTSLNELEAELMGISLCCSSDKAYFVPADLILSENLIKELKSLLEDPSLTKCGHNLKYDIKVLDKYGIRPEGPFFDSMVASYILDPTAGKHGLKYLGEKHLGRQMTSFDELMLAEGASDIRKTDINDLKDYACADGDVTFQLRGILVPQLEEKGLNRVFYDIEMPLVRVLADMELAGVSIDSEKLGSLGVDMARRLKELEKEIYIICGEEFNINSPKQLSCILFDKLNLPSVKKTKTGASTDASVLESLAGEFEIAGKLLEFRQLAKLKSTYADALPLMVNKKTGRIHTSFNQIATATGRLSSSEPNLQNIPVRTEAGRSIREVFVPGDPKDDVIVSADYSQIELRVLAHLSGDERMIEDFKGGWDIHASTASDIFGVDLKDVTKEMRGFAKTINFGIVYGMSSFGLAKTLNIKKNEAEDYINRYFARYKGVKAFMESTIESARKNGYVSTLMGRRRYLPDINSRNQSVRQAEERVAINTPVQGTAADIIKMAMIRINESVKANGRSPQHAFNQIPNLKMIMQIHDELVFECKKTDAAEVEKIITGIMSGVIELKVPLTVNVSSGPSWGQAK